MILAGIDFMGLIQPTGQTFPPLLANETVHKNQLDQPNSVWKNLNYGRTTTKRNHSVVKREGSEVDSSKKQGCDERALV